MSTYNPDSWIVLKVLGDNPFYKVLGGWSGGYLDGDSWRINSGIKSVTFDGEYFSFEGFSGSIYECHKSGYGIRMSIAGVYNKLSKANLVELMPETTVWEELDYGS